MTRSARDTKGAILFLGASIAYVVLAGFALILGGIPCLVVAALVKLL